MVKIIKIEKFIEEYRSRTVIDVRSPVEFKKGHIPGSRNIPLFSDKERAHIGTVYKHEGQEAAIILGESYAQPKISNYLEMAENMSPGNKNLIVYCARGGLRSRRFAELLDDSGFTVERLEKGYKNYRNLVRQSFTRQYPLNVIGGKTGCGKTEILRELSLLNEQVVDLEGMSNHRGSAFGSIGKGNQPSTECFENSLYELLSTFSLDKQIWIEDESANIGQVFIPEEFYRQMKKAPLIVLKMNKEIRVARLCREYGENGTDPLLQGLKKIRKKLGGERTAKAEKAVSSGDYSCAASIILEYYDKCYDFGLAKKINKSVNYLDIIDDDPEAAARELVILLDNFSFSE